MPDSKALTQLGLEELAVNDSPASTDYTIVVNPNTKEPKLALKANENANKGWDSITLTSETGASGSVAVQIVFNDADGTPMTEAVAGSFYISEVATGLTRDPADTGIAVLTNGVIQNVDAAVENGWWFVTDATGKLGFTITAAADSYWAVFTKPNGLLEIVGPLIADA